MESDVRTRLAFHKFAIDVAYRLSSLRDFLAASERLLQLDDPLSDSVFERHGRKLLAMVEVARTTLNRANVKLYLFTSCPPEYRPFKSAYFKMLVMLRRHRKDFSSDLLGRVDRLLLPLTTRLVICHNNDPYAQLGIAESMRELLTAPQPCWTTLGGSGGQPRRTSHHSTDQSSASMPPPDAFPGRPRRQEGNGERGCSIDSNNDNNNKTVLMAKDSRSLRRQRPSCSALDHPPQTDDHIVPGAQRVVSGPRRHFGIFCTGKPQSQRLWNRRF